MKNVVIVAQGLSNGGAERVASILANYMHKKQYNVTFIATYSQEREYYLDPQIRIVDIYSKSKSKMGRLVERNIKLYNAIRGCKADIVYSFITNELLLTQTAGIPVVHSLRCHPAYINSGRIQSALRRVAYSMAHKIVFQTTGAMEFFSSKIQSKGLVIPNPVNVKAMPLWKNEKEHNKTFVTACRLDAQKNLPMMIRGFARFHKKHPEYRLEIYGNGNAYAEMESLIKDLDAGEFVSLMGHASNIHEIMAKAFAFVLTSDYEGLSNSMLEALVIGMPSICTDCPPGGARMFIRDGENGRLIPVGDTDQLVDAFCQVVEEDGLAHKFSANTEIIRNMLDADNICAEWEALI